MMTMHTHLAVLAIAVMLGGCASDGPREPRKLSASDTCAPGKTLICEVSNTGRIKHGSFSKGNKNCSCEDKRAGIPRIPGIP